MNTKKPQKTHVYRIVSFLKPGRIRFAGALGMYITGDIRGVAGELVLAVQRKQKVCINNQAKKSIRI